MFYVCQYVDSLNPFHKKLCVFQHSQPSSPSQNNACNAYCPRNINTLSNKVISSKVKIARNVSLALSHASTNTFPTFIFQTFSLLPLSHVSANTFPTIHLQEDFSFKPLTHTSTNTSNSSVRVQFKHTTSF